MSCASTPCSFNSWVKSFAVSCNSFLEVDTEDQEICPSGNPLLENVVLNTVDDGFFMSPVKVLSVKDLGDLQDSEDSQA